MLDQRVIVPELLDQASPADAARNLADITRLNRWFGGHRILLHHLRSLALPSDAFTFLDVGAASGDMGRVVQRHFPRATVISLDLQHRNLARAPAPKVVGDAFRLPIRSVDFVHTSLFLHHFPDAQVVELLRSLTAAARRALIIQDLERHWLPYRFLPATRPLLRWHPLTLHDGPVSVAAAFRRDELAQLARQAGLADCRVQRHALSFRLSLVAGPAILKLPAKGA